MGGRRGPAFSDACYQTYLEDNDAAFAEHPNYGVRDDGASYGRIAPVIDARFPMRASRS